MKIQLGILFLFSAQLAFAQLALKPLPSQRINQKAEASKESSFAIEKNTLPFWDDFAITPDGMPGAIRVWGTDSTKQWDLSNSRGVFVNSTLAVNPPSYKVITFDGLDSNGAFYGEEQGLTDQLMADTLDLSAYDEADDLYLSFYWQGGGNIEPPDDGDSLTLEFYNKTGSRWESIWSVDGIEVPSDSIFYQERIKLEQRFISDAYTFRFSAYGDQDGPFDAWHLDWVYLNAERADDDFFYPDVSINGDPSILFSPFKSIPTNQIDFPSFSTGVTTSAMNLDDEPDGFGLNLRYSIEIIDTETDELIAFDSVRIDETELNLFLNEDPLVVEAQGIIDYADLSLASLANRDSINLEFLMYVDSLSTQFLDGTPINLLTNDTVRTQTLLHDFYAYDDGTAEYAVGTNIIGGQVGIQFWVEDPDTLTHLDIYFPNIAPSSDGRVLTIRILNELDDVDPLRSQTITVNTADTLNQFERYEFFIETDSGDIIPRPVVVSDTFFITYEQNVNEYIGIGFDRSNFAASPYIFENIEGEWLRNDRLQGAIMIRPVFKSGIELPLSQTITPDDITVYPNPTNGVLKIVGDYQKIELRNLLGQLVLIEPQKASHEFYSLDPGLYIMRVFTDSGVVTKKILKQ